MAELIRPDYYGGRNRLNHWDLVKPMGWDYHLGTATKYLARAGRKTKNPIEDLEKSLTYFSKFRDLRSSRWTWNVFRWAYSIVWILKISSREALVERFLTDNNFESFTLCAYAFKLLAFGPADSVLDCIEEAIREEIDAIKDYDYYYDDDNEAEEPTAAYVNQD